jgi:LysM repeat protein
MASKIIRLPKGAYPGRLGDERVEPTTMGGERIGPGSGADFADLVPPIGWARFTVEDNPAQSVLCELGAGYARVTQGYGGWDEVDRPGNISLTTWRGFKPIGIELALWFDDLANGHSVEPELEMLEALAGRGPRRTMGAGGSYIQPPKLVYHTAGQTPYDAHAFPDMRWVITDIDVDEEQVLVNDVGNRVRAPVTVSLLQHVDANRLQDRALAVSRQLDAQHPRAKRPYTVKSGDTAMSIARVKLGDAGRYQEILKLNGLRDPRALKPGAKLRLP